MPLQLLHHARRLPPPRAPVPAPSHSTSVDKFNDAASQYDLGPLEADKLNSLIFSQGDTGQLLLAKLNGVEEWAYYEENEVRVCPYGW